MSKVTGFPMDAVLCRRELRSRAAFEVDGVVMEEEEDGMPGAEMLFVCCW